MAPTPSTKQALTAAATAIASHERGGLHPPRSASELDKLDKLERALGRPLPPQLRFLYQQCGMPNEWWPDDGPHVVFFHEDVIEDVVAQCREALPGGYLPFADDSGPSWFFIDTEGREGRSPGAIVRCSRSWICESELTQVAEDLAGFLQWMLGSA